ncbi:myosin head, partial [Dictyocaulus viviparus]
DISEENVIRIIEERFNNKRIYIIYNESYNEHLYEVMLIRLPQISTVRHIFSPARSAVENIENGSHSENIVFSGESNSGKSFNAFQVMKYFVTSQNSKITVKHIEAITSIFNSFGCAKTVKNNDATRFGYCMDFLFQKNRLVGLNVCPTLPLEATRVISQKPGERNFNVFYELCAGMPSEVKADYGIRDQQKFFYLSQGKAGEFERNDSANFQRLHASLETMGFSDEHRESIYKTLATILHLGNMYFRERRKTEEGLTSSPYSISQALDVRDALATTLYEALFNWILSRVSSYLKCPDHNAIISVVDCYGIEIPMSLENDEVIDLLSKKPYGLLNLIDDECKFPKTSDESYFRRCNLNHLDKNVYGKAKNKDKLQMSIRHSFGTTWYNVHGFVQRNKRSMPYKMINILANSQNSVISMLFRSLTGNRENADHVLYTAHQFNTSSMAIIEKILNGRSHFIHCLKSNNERLPACLDKALLSRQLSAFSTLETLSFQQTGFPVRISFQRFTQSYRCLLPSDIAFCQNQKEIIIDILDGQGIKYARDFQIGSNYVFLRSRLADQLRITRERIHREAAYVIQKTMRMYVLRKAYLRKRNAVIRIQAAVRAWMAR